MHRFIPDPAAPAEAATLDPAQLIAIKALVREILRLPADTPVLVSETACADAGCPLLETVIAVFPPHAPAMRWRLTRPRAALTRLMLRQTLATAPEPATGVASLDAPVNLVP